ncbi:MAG: hypothetical protein JWO76_1802 [Nocardioides sp.]|nr:hypothetical protein [Nocardioides sp.]
MAILSEAVRSMRVSVSTPNGQVLGEVRGRYEVVVRFEPGYAERVGETELAGQVQRLGRLLFAHRAAAYEELKRAILQPSRSPRPRPGGETYERAYDALSVTGESRDGSVHVTVGGLRSWVVHIDPGAIERLGGEGVARATSEAANDLVARVVTEIKRLRLEHFGRRPT